MNSFTGTAPLVRLALRRDRVTTSAWLLGLAAFTGATTAMFVSSFPTRQDLVRETAFAAASPGIRMLGLASGAGVGAYTMIRDYVTLAVLAAVMSTLTVVRHTRQGEETGRAELLSAAVVGRRAGLAAGVLVAVAANLALAALLGMAMCAAGQPAVGSFAAGTAVAAVGIAFTGIAAVTAQLSSTTRGASGLSAAVLGLAFLASAIGNLAGRVDASGVRVVSAWPAWLSPIGWGQQLRPFGGENWWLLAPFAGLFGLTLVLAGVLATRHDLGQGLLPQRRGRPAAPRTLRGPIGLAWRLQRTVLLGWAVGMLGFGLVFGAVIGQVKDTRGGMTDWYTRMAGSEHLLDAYRASMLQLAGMAAAVYAVQVMLRMRSEELDGPLEPVLAAAVGRPRWAIAYLVTALAGTLAVLVLFALGMAATSAAVLPDSDGHLAALVAAGLVQVPGVLVLGTVVVAAVGLLPRASAAACWTLLLGSIVVGPLFGPTLGLPQWVQNLSAFTHVPPAPAVPVAAGPVLALLAVGGALGLLGLASLRRRDLALPA